ncbi:MAG: CHAT domain-containing protein [Clostridiales bacterium]|nr:CHAT domain-containing protein [Clostridiales bacterium]
MKSRTVKFSRVNQYEMNCFVDNSRDPELHFKDFQGFYKACEEYSVLGEACMRQSQDFARLADKFRRFPKGCAITIETDDYQYIPFEALRVPPSGEFLAQRFKIARKTHNSSYIDGGISAGEGNALILKCFPLARHDYFEKRLMAVFSRYPKVKVEIETAQSKDELLKYLTEKKWMLIHIIAHIENDAFISEGKECIELADLKKELQRNAGRKFIQTQMIAISSCGSLNFVKNEDKLFSMFYKQSEIKSVVGMCRKIHADCDLSYLDAFYEALFQRKTVPQALSSAVARNLSVVSSKETDPLPIVYFGHPNCRLSKRFCESKGLNSFRKKILKSSAKAVNGILGPSMPPGKAALAAVAFIIAVIMCIGAVGYLNRPQIVDVEIKGMMLQGYAKGLGKPDHGKRFIAVLSVRIGDGITFGRGESRFAEILPSGFFQQVMFTSDNEREAAVEGYIAILEIDAQEEEMLGQLPSNDFIEHLNNNYVARKKARIISQ